MFFVLRKFKYIRGYEHEVAPMTKDGFKTLDHATAAMEALKTLEPRPDLISYTIVKDVDYQNFGARKGPGKNKNIS